VISLIIPLQFQLSNLYKVHSSLTALSQSFISEVICVDWGLSSQLLQLDFQSLQLFAHLGGVSLKGGQPLRRRQPLLVNVARWKDHEKSNAAYAGLPTGFHSLLQETEKNFRRNAGLNRLSSLNELRLNELP